MSIELKIKAKVLAAEAKIIRHEERKVKYSIFYHRQKRNDDSVEMFYNKLTLLQRHRRLDVRLAARTTHLARAFLFGYPYHKIEEKAYTTPNIKAIASLVKRYGNPDTNITEDAIKAWVETKK